MDYTWMFYKDYENVNGLLSYFEDAIASEPEELIRQIEGEMDTALVHEGNNQQGRSIVQQSALAGIIAGLEAVRAECVIAIEMRKEMADYKVA